MLQIETMAQAGDSVAALLPMLTQQLPPPAPSEIDNVIRLPVVPGDTLLSNHPHISIRRGVAMYYGPCLCGQKLVYAEARVC